MIHVNYLVVVVHFLADLIVEFNLIRRTLTVHQAFQSVFDVLLVPFAVQGHLGALLLIQL